MPQLVQGHVRFTEEDFLYSDLHHKISDYTTQEKEIPIDQNICILHEEIEYFTEKYIESSSKLYANKDDFATAVKKHKGGIVLSGILDILLVIARKYGYSLEDLIRIQKE
jgi:hypothetical protein